MSLSALAPQEQMLAYKAELEQKVRSLEAESNSTYIGPPPPTVAPKEKVIPSVPVLNMEQPPTIPPLGPQDGRGSAESAMSGMSRFSKKSMGSKSIKSIGALGLRGWEGGRRGG